MTNSNVLLRYWLLSCAELLDALGGDRVWIGNLPAGFDVAQGPGITINCRGGLVHLEAPIIYPSLDVKVWCDVDHTVQAREIDGIIFGFIHGVTMIEVADYGAILGCEQEVFGVDSPDPITGWATVGSSYKVTIRNTVEDLVYLVDGGTF